VINLRLAYFTNSLEKQVAEVIHILGTSRLLMMREREASRSINNYTFESQIRD
jgi:hypothetical protein